MICFDGPGFWSITIQAAIEVEKTFKGKRPCTICRITPVGQQAFANYVEALKDYLQIKKEGGAC